MESDGMIYLSEFLPESELIVEQHEGFTSKFPVIDMHGHFGALLLGDHYEQKYDTGHIVSNLKEYGIKHIVNSDGMWGTELDRILKKIHPYEDFISTFGTVDVTRLEDRDFETYVYSTLKESKEKGIKGLKFWKDISLVLKDRKGKYLRLDDKRLKVIWQAASELDLPVILHIADPVAFFKKVDRFNERYEELHAYPQWAFSEPGMYTFEELMEMQENLIESNPQTTFIVTHVGSYSENLGQVARWLDKYSNMYVDIAVRIAELGRQPYTSRKFFNQYQDRILFGTEMTPPDTTVYPPYYRFLETWDEYFNYIGEPIALQGDKLERINIYRTGTGSDPKWPQGRWMIYGIGLEDDVLKKIYSENAEKILKMV